MVASVSVFIAWSYFVVLFRDGMSLSSRSLISPDFTLSKDTI
jgi:hypothetical protein